MSEISQGSITALAVVLSVASAWVQMIGGRPDGRIFYRFFFPLIFSASVIWVSLLSGSFFPLLLVVVPYYFAVSHLGHHTFLKRLFECIVYGLPSLLCGFSIIFVTQMLCCICATVIGHFFNKKPAPKIEMLVNFLRVFMIPVMVS